MNNKRKKGAAITAKDFYTIGQDVQRRTGRILGADLTEDRRFREYFGLGVHVAIAVWNLMVVHETLPDNAMICHFLWTLHFLKAYPKQEGACAAAGDNIKGAIDPKTFRKYVWPMIDAISNLRFEVILLSNRKNGDVQNDCLMSIDGTDFAIAEQGPIFSSHKFKMKSGLRYEVGLNIVTGELCWTNGPYPCGEWPDVKIFQHFLASELEEDERVEADDGYIGCAPLLVKCPKSFPTPRGADADAMRSRVRRRQETINKRFKQWEILKQKFRHDILDHQAVFLAVSVMTQVAIMNGEPLFSVEYSD